MESRRRFEVHLKNYHFNQISKNWTHLPQSTFQPLWICYGRFKATLPMRRRAGRVCGRNNNNEDNVAVHSVQYTIITTTCQLIHWICLFEWRPNSGTFTYLLLSTNGGCIWFRWICCKFYRKQIGKPTTAPFVHLFTQLNFPHQRKNKTLISIFERRT